MEAQRGQLQDIHICKAEMKERCPQNKLIYFNSLCDSYRVKI